MAVQLVIFMSKHWRDFADSRADKTIKGFEAFVAGHLKDLLARCDGLLPTALDIKCKFLDPMNPGLGPPIWHWWPSVKVRIDFGHEEVDVASLSTMLESVLPTDTHVEQMPPPPPELAPFLPEW